MTLPHYDVIIIGAGAAGLMCGIEAGKRGRRVLILERAAKVEASIQVSAAVHSIKKEDGLFQLLVNQERTAASSLVVATLLPGKFTHLFTELYFSHNNLPLVQIPDQSLKSFAAQLKNWSLIPETTVGYQKAEVTRGGVSTEELSSKTMEAKKVPGLFFIGEVVDVTGWLGGHNFQWAWSSGWTAGQYV